MKEDIMKSKRFRIYCSAFVCLFMMVDIMAQEGSQCIALITAKNGTVMLKRAGKNEFASADWGTQLFQGDQIKTGGKSSVSITYLNNGIMKLSENNLITVNKVETEVSESAGNVKPVTSSMMVNMSALTTKHEQRKDAGALAGLRTAGVEEPIELTSPYSTLIRTNRPTFAWEPKQSYENYIVNLYSSKGLVWSRKVSGSPLKFPETEKELDFGETYFWNVEGEDLLDNKKSSSYRFSVLTVDKSKEVLVQEALIRNTFNNDADSSSLHSFLGAYFINQGLLQDAIYEFNAVSRMNPEAALPHEILGSLYSDVGNKDKAIEELQKALVLSKTNDK
jgi:hypothetical protein